MNSDNLQRNLIPKSIKVLFLVLVLIVAYLYVLNARYTIVDGDIVFDKWTNKAELIENLLPQVQPIIMSEKDSKRKLYDALSQDYDMGTFEQFSNDIQDDSKRKKLYDAISNEYELGDYDSFSIQLGIEKSKTTNTP